MRMHATGRCRRGVISLLALCLALGLALPGSAEEAVTLTVQAARIDEVLLHVGEIENPRPNMGLVQYIELFEGLWLIVVHGADELEVLPLDESGLFARVAMFADTQSGGRIVTPTIYYLLDLDDIPEALSQENVEAVALASALVKPEDTGYDTVFEAAPDARELYPEIDALLEAQAAS